MGCVCCMQIPCLDTDDCKLFAESEKMQASNPGWRKEAQWMAKEYKHKYSNKCLADEKPLTQEYLAAREHVKGLEYYSASYGYSPTISNAEKELSRKMESHRANHLSENLKEESHGKTT